MSLSSYLLAMICLTSIIACILFVLFGQVTVRKLRKNPVTKDALGIKFVSGWDIFNAAMILTFTRKYGRRIKQVPFGTLHANADVLYEHTTRLDRVLARVFFVPWALTGVFAVALMLLDLCEFIKQ
jgi:uncharacterized membrane protein